MSLIHRVSLAAACAATVIAAPAAHACSKAPFPMWRDGVQLIATATPDTLLAGAAGRPYALEPETADGPVYGQVVRVERLGGTEAAALPPGTERVVLVPWGYGPDCRTTRWTESAVWVEPGTRGLFWAGLRPREDWVDGIPTLDVGQPYQLPYPQRADLADPDSLMTVEQAFELIALLAPWDEFEADPEAAREPLLRWARENPGPARLYPASLLVEVAMHDIRDARLERVEVPLVGTYRFSASVDGGPPRTFYAASRAVPMTEWDRSFNPWVDEVREPPPPDAPFAGYTLMFTGALSADSLPGAGGAPWRPGREGYVNVLAAPDSTVDGVQLWRGTMELGLVSAQFPDDPVLAALDSAGFARYSRRSRAGEPQEILARFLLRPDGSVVMEQTSVLDDGRTVVITGERVSRATLPRRD